MQRAPSRLCSHSSRVIVSRLDLNDNAMIVDYNGASPASTVRANLKSGRNNGLWNNDWALIKTTQIREQLRLEFRFEAFNVFNHPTFATGMGGNSGAPATFARTSTPGEPRRLQFGLKLHY